MSILSTLARANFFTNLGTCVDLGVDLVIGNGLLYSMIEEGSGLPNAPLDMEYNNSSIE